LGPVRSCWW